MQRAENDTNTASVSAKVSLRTAAVLALATALGSNVVQCAGSRSLESRFDRLEQKIDNRLETVAEKQHELGIRLARIEGARGAGGE
jgi:coenzyme F420-reducing hydrogenase delta subunit